MRQTNIPKFFSMFWIKWAIYFFVYFFGAYIFIPSGVEATQYITRQESSKNDFSFFVGNDNVSWANTPLFMNSLNGITNVKDFIYKVARNSEAALLNSCRRNNLISFLWVFWTNLIPTL